MWCVLECSPYSSSNVSAGQNRQRFPLIGCLSIYIFATYTHFRGISADYSNKIFTTPEDIRGECSRSEISAGPVLMRGSGAYGLIVQLESLELRRTLGTLFL